MTVSWPTCWALGGRFARGDTRDRRPTIRFVSGRFAVFLTGCFQSPIKTPRYSTGCAPSCPRRYITGHFSLSIPHHHFSKHHTLLYTLQCGRGTTAKLKEYSYQVVTLPNLAPPMPHNQATMPRNCVVSSASLPRRVLTATTRNILG